jgi:hypothetical protein
MSAAVQAVRPKHASPETKRRPVQPQRAMLSGSPRYLRASVRLGGLHDPQEHEAERAASTIPSGGSHQVHDPGGSGSLRATGAEMARAEAGAARSMAAVTRPGSDGGVRCAATHEASDPGGAQHLRAASAHRVIDPGAEGQVRRAVSHEAAEPGGMHYMHAVPDHRVVYPGAEGRIRRSAAQAGDGQPVRAMHTTAWADKWQHCEPGVAHRVVDPGGAASLRATPAPGVIDPGASGRIRRSPEHAGGDPGHVRATVSDVRPTATEAVRSAAASGHASHDADAEAADRIEMARKGVGQPLPANVRTRLEHGFGERLDGVRVDGSAAARAAAASIGARAYTEGERITLGHGESEHDLRLMAHEATHVVQNRRAGQRGQPAAVALTEIRRDVQRAAEQESEDSRTYHTLDGRTIELPDDMTAAEAHKLEMDGVAAKRHLGQGPPPKPVPDVHKPAEKKATKTVKPPPKGAAGPHARHAAGPHSVGVKVQLKPLGSKVGQYLVAKAAPVLARGVGKIGNLSLHQQTHDNADRKVHQAEKAVVIPESDGQSKSNFSQVGVVAAKPPPEPDENKAKDELTQSLAQNVPKSIEDVDNFKRDMKAQHTGADVLKVVQTDKNAVVSTFGDMEHTPAPLPPEHAPEALPAPEVAPPTGTMELGQGAVAPLQPEHTDVSQYTKEADDRLQKEGVTQEQLDMVDSGDLADANREKKGLEKAAKTEPQAVQNFAKDATAKVDRDLHAEEQAQRGALAAHRRQGLHKTGEQQKGAKSALEKKRDEVAATINGIYQTTQDSVKKRLADLETQSMKRFDDGNARASKAFEDNVNRELDAYKDDRYSGVFGWARKAKDWLLGMDDLPRVKEIFDTNRDRFVQTLNSLVADISADNKRVVQECKDALAKAKTDIKVYVDKLGPELKDIANKTAGEVNGKLDELDGFIRKKEEELQKKLADKQQAAIKAIDEKIAKMKEAMAGALHKLGQLLLLAAKKFFAWALGKFGYSWSDIEAIIDRGVAVLKAIVTKPIQFVKNLIAAAKLGFLNFGKNFLVHLKDAIFDWLTGSLEGLTLPSSWDLKGIASVALQMLGLTWANIRGKLVKLLGETTVKVLESGFDLVVTLVRDGPMAAWEKLQDMAGEIKQAFIAAVQDFIVTKIITEAIKTIIAIFVPGAGIVKAIIAIYDTVVFFIQKAKQIAEMVGNFLGAIGEIASGNIAVGADALEKGLATALKLVINFLARFLHLDAITAKIRSAIQKIRDKVDAALDRVVDWIADKARKLVKIGKSAIKKIAGWMGLRRPFKTIGGESHVLFFKEKGNVETVFINSVEMSLETFLADLVTKYAADPAKLGQVHKAQGLVHDILRMTASTDPKAASAPPDAQIDAAVATKIDELGVILHDIGDGVSLKGATAAYRGLHWWVTPGREAAQDEAELAQNIARQYVGARQLSDAVNAILKAVPGPDPSEGDIDTAVQIVRAKMSELRDSKNYDAEGMTYVDRFHMLLGRFVTSLKAFQTRIGQAGRLHVLPRELEDLNKEMSTLRKDSGRYAELKRQREEKSREHKDLKDVPTAYQELQPDVQASPFISTSLDPVLTARYALGVGKVYTPPGKEPRTVGTVGRILIFVASLSDLAKDGAYSIDELKGAGHIKMRKTFSESELTFTGDIPGAYLRAQLDAHAGEPPTAVAGNAKARAAAEAQRFGGLK